MKSATLWFAHVCAWTCQNPLTVPAQQRAATTQTPRRPTGAGGGERIEPVRLGVRDHHRRSLCAESPAHSGQWCCWIGRSRILSGSAEIAAIQAISAMQLGDQRPRQDSNRQMSFRRSLLLQLAGEASQVPQFRRTRGNFPSYFNPFAKTTFASSSPLSPATQSGSLFIILPAAPRRASLA
jgi:hypothetical protein